MVITVDVYKEIHRLQLEGVTSQRRSAEMLGISRNTVRKYWEGNAVPWERQSYEQEAAVLTPEVIRFIENFLDADAKEHVRKQRHRNETKCYLMPFFFNSHIYTTGDT